MMLALFRPLPDGCVNFLVPHPAAKDDAGFKTVDDFDDFNDSPSKASPHKYSLVLQ